MSRHNFSLVIVFIAICFIFTGAVLFSVRQARGDTVAAHRTAAIFYAHLQKHDFAKARALLTNDRQEALSTATLANTLAAFEKKHGPLTRWELTETPTTYGNRISIFPRYVEESRLLIGTKGNAGGGILHLQPEDGTWKIGRLSIVP